jgi:uncharacterized membrane protein
MKQKIYIAVRCLAVLGIVLAVYLLWERYATPDFQPCNVNSRVNCNAIISGEVSNTWGIPTPIIGLTGYIIILLASIFKKPRLLLAMATFGLCFCLWIGFRELFQLHVVCPVCITCQLAMTTIFVLSLILNFKKNLSISNAPKDSIQA